MKLLPLSALLLAIPGCLSQAQEEFGNAERVIYILLEGGVSQIETFDPISDDTWGDSPTERIPTSVPGTFLSSWLPQTADILDRCALIRTVVSGDTHASETYFTRTGQHRRSTIIHPELGSFLKLLQKTPDAPFVRLNGTFESGPGFLEGHYGAAEFPDVDQLQNFSETLSNFSITNARNLVDANDWYQRQFAKENRYPWMGKAGAAARLLAEERWRTALDWSEEDDDTLAKYGKNAFGRSCVVARRLAEANAFYVEVVHPGWGGVVGHVDTTKKRCEEFDPAFATLILELESRGLLETTLVAVVSNLGRGPLLTDDAWRNDWRLNCCALLAGGGIRGGQVIGSTTPDGRRAISGEWGRIDHSRLNATIARALRINPDEVIYDMTKRPHRINPNDPETKLPIPGLFKK